MKMIPEWMPWSLDNPVPHYRWYYWETLNALNVKFTRPFSCFGFWMARWCNRVGITTEKLCINWAFRTKWKKCQICRNILCLWSSSTNVKILFLRTLNFHVSELQLYKKDWKNWGVLYKNMKYPTVDKHHENKSSALYIASLIVQLYSAINLIQDILT